jgi:hypothetical protein
MKVLLMRVGDYIYKCLRFLIIISCIVLIWGVCVWFTRPWEKIQLLDVLDSQALSLGQDELKKHKVVIVGIVRDSVLGVYSMTQYVERLENFVKDYRVIVFENDSTDGTKWMLERWAKKNNKVKILSEDFGYQRRPSIKFLADIRNRYIDELHANPEYADFDIVMVTDMDMTNGWDMRGIFDTFSKTKEWDAVCSNGLFYGESTYDMFAFRNEEFPTSLYGTKDFWPTILAATKRYYPVGTPLMKMDSCFGSMAFYKKQAIKDCRYESINEDCEHVAFHKCIIDKNRGRMVMNPSQVVRYFAFDWLLWPFYWLF